MPVRYYCMNCLEPRFFPDYKHGQAICQVCTAPLVAATDGVDLKQAADQAEVEALEKLYALEAK